MNLKIFLSDQLQNLELK